MDNTKVIVLGTLYELIAEVRKSDPNSLLAAKAEGVALSLSAGPGQLAVKPRRYRDSSRDMEIVKLYQDGLTPYHIGSQLGCCVSTVRNALGRQGIRCRKHGEAYEASRDRANKNGERVEFIRAQLALGRTMQDIGSDLRITRERVRQICVANGIDTARQLTPEQLAAVKDYVGSAESLDCVAARHGVNCLSLRAWIVKAGHRPRHAPRRGRDPQTLVRSERAVELYRKGLKIKDIAAEIGVSKPQMIYRLLAIGGVSARRRPRHREAVQ